MGLVVDPFFRVVTAICVGANAEKRKKKVPRNSPIMATKWLRIVLRDPDVQFPRAWNLVGGSWSILSSETVRKKVDWNETVALNDD